MKFSRILKKLLFSKSHSKIWRTFSVMKFSRIPKKLFIVIQEFGRIFQLRSIWNLMRRKTIFKNTEKPTEGSEMFTEKEYSKMLSSSVFLHKIKTRETLFFYFKIWYQPTLEPMDYYSWADSFLAVIRPDWKCLGDYKEPTKSFYPVSELPTFREIKETWKCSCGNGI